MELKNYTNNIHDNNFSFSMNIKLQFGQHLCIAGGIPTLGLWNEPVLLEWSEGDNWILPDLDIMSNFQYKYVIRQKRQPDIWEKGPNRIFDSKLLVSQNRHEVNDIWESYTVNFQIYYPLKEHEHMRINGGPPQLGDWLMQGPRLMELAKEPIIGLTGE